jgi:hypothetical protein
MIKIAGTVKRILWLEGLVKVSVYECVVIGGLEGLKSSFSYNALFLNITRNVDEICAEVCCICLDVVFCTRKSRENASELSVHVCWL